MDRQKVGKILYFSWYFFNDPYWLDFIQTLQPAYNSNLNPIPTASATAKCNWFNFGFIHSKNCIHLNNNNWVKKLVAIYQNLRSWKEINEDIWFEESI